MEKYKWTNEADEIIRRMSDDGSTYADICDTLGITDKQLSNRLSVLRRKDPSFPRPTRDERREVVADTDGEIVCAAEARQSDEPVERVSKDEQKSPEMKGDLNPLEQEMARMIEERERMLRHKDEQIGELESTVQTLRECVNDYVGQVNELLIKLERKDRVIGKMAEQLFREEV